MFLATTPTTRTLHPSWLAQPPRHWPVLTRALEAPWYLLVYQVDIRRGGRLSQTSLVAGEDTLVSLLAEIAPADLTGIARLDRQHGTGPGWSLQWLDAAWSPGPAEARGAGHLLMRFDDDTQVRNALLHPVPDASGRRLLTPVSWPRSST